MGRCSKQSKVTSRRYTVDNLLFISLTSPELRLRLNPLSPVPADILLITILHRLTELVMARMIPL
jgi:hypothetical protein